MKQHPGVSLPVKLFCAVFLLCLSIGAAAGREVQGVALDVDFFRSANEVALNGWIERSMAIVLGYYGVFPVKHLTLHVLDAQGGGVKTGTTYGMQGGMIRIAVGREVTDSQLRDDWVLVHEMIHLALPDVSEGHAWLSEGLATYVEGIARAQAGNRTEEDVWHEQMHSMPKGLPQAADQGLDHTHTWGRTYWGGALFCLSADVQIRRQTGNRLGLQDALREILRQSGGLPNDWPIERIFAVGDAAVGTHVLEELYRGWKERPVRPDLPALWQQLGIEAREDTVVLHDDAPLAATRRAIMHKP